MFKVAVDGRGRFGNNLIQYFAVKRFCSLFGCTYVLEKKELHQPRLVTESQFFSLLLASETPLQLTNDVFLEGFFQDISFLSRERMFIKALFSRKNTDVFNYHHYEKKMVIQDLVIDAEEKPGRNDLVLHLRLDDFMHQGHNSNILDVNYYIQAVLECEPSMRETIWLVVDKLEKEFDKKYMNVLLNALKKENGMMNIRFHQKTFLEDWTFCMNAKHFISSNSTFALTAILLGDMNYVVLPTEASWTNVIPIAGILNCKIVDNVKRIDSF
jgi:hypothetical protein